MIFNEDLPSQFESFGSLIDKVINEEPKKEETQTIAEKGENLNSQGNFELKKESEVIEIVSTQKIDEGQEEIEVQQEKEKEAVIKSARSHDMYILLFQNKRTIVRLENFLNFIITVKNIFKIKLN